MYIIYSIPGVIITLANAYEPSHQTKKQQTGHPLLSAAYYSVDSPPAGGPPRGENVPPARFLTPLGSSPDEGYAK